MESAAYWSPLGFFTSWRHLNLIVCQTGSSSHLNKHAKGEVQFVSPQLENVSLESLLVLSCKSFTGLMGSGLNRLFQIQGDFFNWASPKNVSRLAPPKFAWSGPPLNFLSV